MQRPLPRTAREDLPVREVCWRLFKFDQLPARLRRHHPLGEVRLVRVRAGDRTRGPRALAT